MSNDWNAADHPRGQAGLFSEREYRDPGRDVLGAAPLRRPLTDADIAELRSQVFVRTDR